MRYSEPGAWDSPRFFHTFHRRGLPLIVVCGALTIVFKGLPPEDEDGDRYHALSRAVQAAQDPRLAPLGKLGGLLVVESRR
jgi:hypothetical protein